MVEECVSFVSDSRTLSDSVEHCIVNYVEMTFASVSRLKVVSLRA